MTSVELKALIDSLYPNNNIGLITPAAERQALKAIIDFAAENQGTIDTSSFLFDVNFSYSIGDPVIYDLKWYVSQEDTNIGNIPSTSPTEWAEISAFDGTFGFWEPGLYIGAVTFVVNNDILYYLDRDEVGNEPFNSVNFATELSAGAWVALTADGIPEAPVDGETYARKDAGWVVLPEVVAGARIESFDLNIISDTEGEVTAVWYNAANTRFSVEDVEIVFNGAPGTDDFRWDLVELLDDGNVNVNSGTEADPPVRPTPTANALIGSEIIWDDQGEPQQQDPTPVNAWSIKRFTTITPGGSEGLFAKIWEGNISISNNYQIILGYGEPKSATTFEGSGAGILRMNFTADASRNIIADTVQLITSSDSTAGEFRLIQITGTRAALYHKSNHYWGRIQWRILFQNSAVRLQDFFDGSGYAAAPSAVATYNSVPESGGGGSVETVTGPWVNNTDPLNPIIGFQEASERENNTVLFDQNYIIGNAAARTGNILFDFTGAKLGAWTEMKHEDASAFTFPAEAVLMFASADISTTVANYFLFVLTKKSATEIVKVFHAIEGGV
jgi:hypothetical protein